MKNPRDNFSKQAFFYKKYRPTYPRELYGEILKYVENRETCWDCATGNGQVAFVLSDYFKTVYGTDISQNQLNKAEKRENISYRVERAETTSFENNYFDLITVAQAIHWFDIDAFNKEALRVARKGGIIAVWGYGLLRIDKIIDAFTDKFYYETMGPYWAQERSHVDNAYSSVNLDFEPINKNQNFFITTHWNLKQLEGYLNSWSSVQNYKNENAKANPVGLLIKNLASYWPDNQEKPVKFPIFLKVVKVEK
jgi:ubiquinone/menaquinone biosynthesis C-methylase UbiE